MQPPSTAAAFLPTPEPPAYQPPPYSTVAAPAPVQQPTATRVDLSDYEKRQAELEAREKRIAEREQAVTNRGLVNGKYKIFYLCTISMSQ